MSAGSTVVIYHTSDIHARAGFGERLAALVEPGAVLVDCGDALAGSSWLYARREKVVDELRRAPYRAMAVGNREFHYLHPMFLARANALPAPLVCTNVIDLRGRTPPFVRELTLDVADVRLRILSFLVPQYRTGSGWERIFGWRFLAPDVALQEHLASEQVSPTIVLSHLGLTADRVLAQRWPQLSVIFGGHSHDTLAQPEIVGGIPVAHAGAHACYVGRMELEVKGSHARMRRYELLPLVA